ncbi:phospholipase A1-IIdelta-like [Macadamia integrifolia]|uniref:phospholipase A1-IIdelta-like n=1 Tax=Macadamia integrifolia TaxID=60698 RepID=UPI001C53115F|nr:phospholipase A1-IIdelta-like [Macadamia integrifolia]
MATDEPTWPELLGSNHWEGLLDPLDLNLRKLILRCGDLCQATYDAFNSDQNSKYCGSSRYGKSSFFPKVSFPSASDYEVAAFLYATSRIDVPQSFLLHSLSREAWDRESNWIGYIAVTTDQVSQATGRREIYVAWRGTIRNLEWIDVLDPHQASIKTLLNPTKQNQPLPLKQQKHHWYEALFCHHHHHSNYEDADADDDDDDDDEDEDEDEKKPKVMKGWFTIYTSKDPRSPFTQTSARTQLLTKIKQLVTLYKDEDLSITFAGHSLGASLSILSAFDLVENGLTTIPIAAFVFGCPQVGNKAFNDMIDSFPNLRILHIRNKIDVIPHYPSRLLGYRHSGIELEIDTRKSPNLKDSKFPGDWHNLQAMLHIVAGWNGEGREFELKVKRTLALVNKSCDFLKDECLVPASWWVEKNKGMLLNEDGDWVLAQPDDDDMPVPEY